MPCFSYYLLCLLFNKIREEEGRTSSAQRWGRGQTMYTHLSKCKNDKIKLRKRVNRALYITF
jgi:hypothetical protein